MTEVGTYIAILSLTLAVPIALAMKTLLALKARVIVPILRVCNAGGATEAITRQAERLETTNADRTRGYAVGASTILLNRGGRDDYSG